MRYPVLESKISKKDPKTCPTCGKNFSRPIDVKRHISSVHDKNKPFQCDHCKHCSTNKSALNRHIQGNLLRGIDNNTIRRILNFTYAQSGLTGYLIANLKKQFFSGEDIDFDFC